jgi:hypothetical protein
MRPHITICYSTSSQPAKPIVDVLGTRLPGCDIDISALSLVIQHGPERAWDWSIRQHDPPCHTGADLAQHRPVQRAADTDTPPANCYAAAASLSSKAPNILQDNVTVQAPVLPPFPSRTQSLSGLSPSGTYDLARYRVLQDNSSGWRLTLRGIFLCSAFRSAADWFRGLLTRC